MNLNIYFVVFCFLFLCKISTVKSFSGLLSSDDVIQVMSSMQIIRTFGYPAEAHEVLTADGYILEMHRIPQGKNFNVENLENSRNDKPPVLIHHGLLGTSANYLLIGPEQGLPFLLADMGYDVWLGNFRGNTYSRGNVNFTSRQKEFWEFTWHESGVYDLAAEIDFVREFTHHDKIIYMGVSMGTTTFFVLMSERPEYNDKILVSHLLAPVAYTEHVKSPLINFLVYTYLADAAKEAVELLFSGEFLPQSPLLRTFEKIYCQPLHIQSVVCQTGLFLITGFDYREMNDTIFNRLLGHYPAGYSMKGVLLYGRNQRSGKFQAYDYGREKNLQKYGSTQPPEYKVENIRAPMYFYVGKNDFLATMPDIEKLKKRLSSLQSEYVVKYPKFQHYDFLLSKDVKEQVYNQLINDMTTFLENNTNYVKK